MSNIKKTIPEKIIGLLEEQNRRHNQVVRLLEKLLEAQKTSEPSREYLTVAEVAKMMHRSDKTVRRWISEKKLPARKICRGTDKDRLYVHKESVFRMIEGGL